MGAKRSNPKSSELRFRFAHVWLYSTVPGVASLGGGAVYPAEGCFLSKIVLGGKVLRSKNEGVPKTMWCTFTRNIYSYNI